ncbi:MAG: peptide chain release factor N(5)-glutamine methyltransferase [Candidatus Cloacimonetes bacterium]|nr:peptide chain release factor N(5)-glutamine methyltransferase [Candidatus Cloacimonadota bacterium]
MTLAGLLADLEPKLAPSADLAYLLSGLLDCPVPALTLQLDKELDLADEKLFRAGIHRLLTSEPPQYILGKAWFWGLELQVDHRVLIPRPETEGLVEIALTLLKPDARVLEIGTGSGAIAIALAKSRPELRIAATDISNPVLELARANASRHGCAIDFVLADLFPPGDARFDLVISNPPYVSPEEYSELEPGVRDFEPPLALLAQEDGLEFYRRIFLRLHNYLQDDGMALFEHGYSQRAGIINLGAKAGFDCFLAQDDLAGRNRYLGLQKRSHHKEKVKHREKQSDAEKSRD